MMPYASVAERFAAQVARQPHAVAIVAGEFQISYQELDARSNRLAHQLLAAGVVPDQVVAVLMERSADLVTAILAVLKAGAGYLPLHHAQPRDRLQWIIDNAGRPVLLADAASLARTPLTSRHTLMVPGGVVADHPVTAPVVPRHPDQLAYVMYTSGSTGTPKGVAVTQRAVLSLALDPVWDSGAHQRVPLIAPHAFDVSTYELWVPLLHGGCVIVPPPGELDIAALAELITGEQVTGLHLTAGLFRVLAQEAPECLAGVREVMTGGDVVSPAAVRRVLAACPDLVVRAMYGPTETTLFATDFPMTAQRPPEATVPIGGPMVDVRAYVLDDQLQPVPTGQVGELYLAGPRLARGYVNRPDLTAERFIADPFHGRGERMYRTGDLVRKAAGGELDFVGRADDQVKIRGFRVELAEVEAAVARSEQVADVAVVARIGEPGDRSLAAYVVPAQRGASVDLAVLRERIAAALPEYMVPASMTVLEALPVTANGKLDREALPEPAAESAYQPPANPVEAALCEIFAEVLGVDRVGRGDNFFILGGQSLLAMRLVNRIRAKLGQRVSIMALFDTPTVAGLAAQLPG